ncbi:MAG: hypothetical protein BWK79_06270 [Beggiatoa sp. IS2]|nr:MAG: hypothetical protein BWK79_06270 [Beggiatoa sp. IS2]
MSTNTGMRSLLIPLGEKHFLVPSACVAEVTSYREPERVADMQPAWLLGTINWRNQRVPVLAIENVLSLPIFAKNLKRRIIIFYGLELNQVLPFYAIVATDIPRALSVAEDHLGQLHDEKPTGVVFSVEMLSENVTVWLPDVSYLESLFRKSLGFLGLKG